MTDVYWLSETVVIEWPITDVDGAPVTSASVTGTITLPDGTTAPAAVTHDANVYRASYDPTSTGTHAYRLVATGAADGAKEGTFEVRPSPHVALPPELDPSTDVGRVRLLIPDRVPGRLLFSDADITAFMAMEGGVKKATALALETIASSEVMVSKVIKTQDLQTDGSRVSAELRARAAELRRQVDEDDPDGGGGFDYVDFHDPFNRRTGELTEDTWGC